jgi:F-type H+-transporting ATPase subunit epsilon
MNRIKVSVLSPNAPAYVGEADALHLATEEGEMDILPGHAALIGLIDFSVLKVKNGQHNEEFYLRGGTVSVEDGETVKILAQDVQSKVNFDLKSLKDYMEFVISRLSKPEELSKYQMKFLEEQKDALEKNFTVIEK